MVTTTNQTVNYIPKGSTVLSKHPNGYMLIDNMEKIPRYHMQHVSSAYHSAEYASEARARREFDKFVDYEGRV